MRLIDGDKLYAVLNNIADHLFEKKSEPQNSMAQTIQYVMEIVRDQPNIILPPNDPLTLEELREMDGEPIASRRRGDMDYKELIRILRDEDRGDVLDWVDDAADAIETMLAERDAMIFERNAAVDEMRGICKYCKHSPPSHRKTACYDCCDDNHNWQWRGPKKEGDQ